MEQINIVIDTNVVLTAMRSKQGAAHLLLSRIGDRRWRMNVSTALILEYEGALKKELRRQGRPLSVADDVLDVLVAQSDWREIFFRWRPFLSDPKDDFVLELGVASGAMFIVTYNLRDFVGSEAFGIVAVRPMDFLRLLERVR